MSGLWNRWNTPGVRFVSVLIVGLAFVLIALNITLQEPTFGFNFQVGDVLEANGRQMTLVDTDLIPEPGDLGNHEKLRNFYQRQNELAELLSQGTITLTRAGETQRLTAKEKTLSDISILFWIQAFVGFGALAISGWIWALRSRDFASFLFVGSGISMFMSALPSAIYTGRELALPYPLFRILEEFNASGAALFGISMIALFIVYPVRLKNWKKWVIAEAVFFGAWLTLFLLKLTPDVGDIMFIIASAMLAICVAIGFQFLATKNNPTARASLTWLGLSVLSGAGAFVVFNTLPLILGLKPLNQGYAFLFFLIIYLGLAAGLTRYRLFEVGQWAFRFLFYSAGTLALVLLDAALVFGLEIDRFPALGVSLLVVGFLYLPLRDWFWRFFNKYGRMESHELLAEALHVAFAPSSSQRAERWEKLLRKMFDPLQIKPMEASVTQVEILQDGLTLVLPAVASTPALQLVYPWSGRSLYTPQSQKLAGQIVSFIQQAESNRDAYDRGVLEERRRMAQDLHDDVGARLLTGLNMADEKLRPTLQGAIADIRSIVSGMTGEQMTLEKLLADLRFETARRLSAVNIELHWPLLESDNEKVLNYRQHKAIGSAIREIISNVIRHSQAKQLQVKVVSESGAFRISLKDNGRGIPQEVLRGESQGYGLKSLRWRLADIGGSCEIEHNKGTTVHLIIPC